MKKIIGLLSILTLMVLTACSNSDVKTLKAQEGVSLFDVSISNVYPTSVVEGTLMYIEGENFGIAPTTLKIGDTEVEEFLSWDENLIFFRAPKGLTSGRVLLGDDEENFEVNVLEDGIKVVWEFDKKDIDSYLAENYMEYGLSSAPEVEGQLYIKGQWEKVEGNFSSSWDKGKKVRMFFDGEKYTSEFIMTEENFKTYENGYILFAFEDENQKDKSLSKYESNASYIIKKSLAKKDKVENVDSDPALVLLEDTKNIKFEINK